MKALKPYLNTILQIALFISLVECIKKIDSPTPAYVLLFLWIFYMLYDLYSKVQYIKGKKKYLLLHTINDQYYKVTSITLGTVVLLLTIGGTFWTTIFDSYLFIGYLVGPLILLNGILGLPKGKIQIKSNNISITGLDKTMDLRQISSIEINNDKIIMRTTNNQTAIAGNLDIDSEASIEIEKHLSNYNSDSNFKIENKVC